MVYDVYLFCELYLLSLKIFIFVSFKNKFFFFLKRNPDKIFPAEATKGFTGSCFHPVHSLGNWEQGPCPSLGSSAQLKLSHQWKASDQHHGLGLARSLSFSRGFCHPHPPRRPRFPSSLPPS